MSGSSGLSGNRGEPGAVNGRSSRCAAHGCRGMDTRTHGQAAVAAGSAAHGVRGFSGAARAGEGWIPARGSPAPREQGPLWVTRSCALSRLQSPFAVLERVKGAELSGRKFPPFDQSSSAFRFPSTPERRAGAAAEGGGAGAAFWQSRLGHERPRPGSRAGFGAG